MFYWTLRNWKKKKIKQRINSVALSVYAKQQFALEWIVAEAEAKCRKNVNHSTKNFLEQKKVCEKKKNEA